MSYLRHLLSSGATAVLTVFFAWLYGRTQFSNDATDTVARWCSYFGIYGVENVLDAYMYAVLAVSFLLASLVVWRSTGFIQRKRSRVK